MVQLPTLTDFTPAFITSIELSAGTEPAQESCPLTSSNASGKSTLRLISLLILRWFFIVHLNSAVWFSAGAPSGNETIISVEGVGVLLEGCVDVGELVGW